MIPRYTCHGCRTRYPVPLSGRRHLFSQELRMPSFSGKCPWLENHFTKVMPPFPRAAFLWWLVNVSVLAPSYSLASLWRATSASEQPMVLTKPMQRLRSVQVLYLPSAAFFSSLLQLFALRVLLIKLSAHCTPPLDLLSAEANLQ